MAGQDGVRLGFTAEGHLDEDAMRQLAEGLDRRGLPDLVRHRRTWTEHVLFCDECEERLEAVREELEWEAIQAPVLPPPLRIPDAEPGLLERIWEGATGVWRPSVPAGATRTGGTRGTDASVGAAPEVRWQDDACGVVANRRLFGGTEFRAQRMEDPPAPLAGFTIDLQLDERRVGPVTTDADGIAEIEGLEFDADLLAQARLRLRGPRPTS